MNVISSKQTFIVKRAFPGLWLGGLAVFIVAALASPRQRSLGDGAVFLVVPLLMLIFGGFMFRKLLWDLADEVRDGGSYLLVRRGAIEQHIALADIMSVSMSQYSNPRRLTLRLRTPCRFGDEIAFIPRVPGLQLNPFARNAVAEDLMRRVDRARRGAAA